MEQLKFDYSYYILYLFITHIFSIIFHCPWISAPEGGFHGTVYVETVPRGHSRSLDLEIDDLVDYIPFIIIIIIMTGFG